MTSEPRNCIKLSSKKETKPLNFKTNQHLLLLKSEPYAIISTYHPSTSHRLSALWFDAGPWNGAWWPVAIPTPDPSMMVGILFSFPKPIWRIVVSFCSMHYLICFNHLFYPHSSETWVTWTHQRWVAGCFCHRGSSATAPLPQSLLWSERCL